MAIDKIVSGLTKSGVAGGLAGGVAGGALASTLFSKKGRKHLGTVAKVGGVAALGGLAWKAYQSYQSSNQSPNPSPAEQDGVIQGAAVQSPAPAHHIPSTANQPAGGALNNAGVYSNGIAAPTAQVLPHRAQTNNPTSWAGLNQSGFDIEAQERAGDSQGLLLVRAMIAAAHSDGEIDMDEQARIFSKAAEAELSQQEKATILDELQNPLKMQDIIKMVTTNELAIEVYLVSLLAIDETKPEGQNYLNALAFMLNLPSGLVSELHQQAAQAEAA